MRYYAVIDTNVIVSAMLKWDSVPGQVVRFVFEGKIVPLLHSAVVEEYHKVLLRPKFHLPEQIVDNFSACAIYPFNSIKTSHITQLPSLFL